MFSSLTVDRRPQRARAGIRTQKATKRSGKFERDERVAGVVVFHTFIQSELRFGLELESEAQAGWS